MRSKPHSWLQIIGHGFFLILMGCFLAAGIGYIVWIAKIYPNTLLAAMIFAAIIGICIVVSESKSIRRYKQRRF